MAPVTPPIVRVIARDGVVHRIRRWRWSIPPGSSPAEALPRPITMAATMQDRGHRHADARGTRRSRRDASSCDPRRARSRAAPRVRHAVQHDRQDHDPDAGREGGTNVEGLERLIHVRPEARIPDRGGDHDDAERHHDRLVDAEHDRGLRERELHLAQHLAGRRAERRADLDGRLGNGADPEAGRDGSREAARRSRSRSSPIVVPMLNSSTNGTR